MLFGVLNLQLKVSVLWSMTSVTSLLENKNDSDILMHLIL